MHEHVLITGGAGFIGSSLAIALKRACPNIEVTAFDNLHRRGSELNLPRLMEAGVRFIHGDIRSPEDFKLLPEPPDLIVECSAEPSAQAGYSGSPEYLIQTNLMGCFHCLELARKTKADFLFISTSRVYPFEALNSLQYREHTTRFVLCERQEIPGASGKGVKEEFPLQGPRSLYGMSKLSAEFMVAEYADAYGFRYVINRCGLVTGPWQMGKLDQGVVALWVAAHHFRTPLDYVGFGGQGKQVRDLLHVDDLCDLLARQVEHFDQYSGRVFNVGGGLDVSLSLQEMTTLCEEVTGNRIQIGIDPRNRPADVRIYLTDHSRLTEFDGWKPSRNAKSIIGDISAWINSEEALVKKVLAC